MHFSARFISFSTGFISFSTGFIFVLPAIFSTSRQCHMTIMTNDSVIQGTWHGSEHFGEFAIAVNHINVKE